MSGSQEDVSFKYQHSLVMFLVINSLFDTDFGCLDKEVMT